MKIYFISIILLAILTGCSKSNKTPDESLNSIYDHLDEEIGHSREYEVIKENGIAKLRRDLAKCKDESLKTELLNKLAEEYSAYNADSALYYVSLNLNREIVKQNPTLNRRLMIKKADIMAHAGMFSDAQDILFKIHPADIEPELKEEYYATYASYYQYLSEYNSQHETAQEYEQRRSNYADSVNSVVNSESFSHLVYVMAQHARDGHADEAIKSLEKHLKDYKSGEREYSILHLLLHIYTRLQANHPSISDILL